MLHYTTLHLFLLNRTWRKQPWTWWRWQERGIMQETAFSWIARTQVKHPHDLCVCVCVSGKLYVICLVLCLISPSSLLVLPFLTLPRITYLLCRMGDRYVSRGTRSNRYSTHIHTIFLTFFLPSFLSFSLPSFLPSIISFFLSSIPSFFLSVSYSSIYLFHSLILTLILPFIIFTFSISHLDFCTLRPSHFSARTHETFIGPPLDDEDGASRVLDPIFSHINSGGTEKHHGNFYKDYFKASW